MSAPARFLLALLAAVLAVHAHVRITLYGCPVSVPLLPLAAAVVVLSAAVAVAAVTWLLHRNRYPRFCWLAVTA